MNTISEKLLLYRLQAKHDPDAFAELYDLYVQRIYRFVYFKVSSQEEAEDITSEVFLRAWNYVINDSSGESKIKSFSGLLYRVARNAVIDSYRRRNGRTEPMGEEAEKELSDGGRWYEDLNIQVEARRIVQCLKKLKQEYQEIITLRYVDELEISEIAEITEKGNIAVRVTLHRGLKKLKEILDRESGEKAED